MRRSLLAVALGAAVLAAVPLAASADAASAHHSTQTNTTVLRPVTSSGHAAHGYRIEHGQDAFSPLYCGGHHGTASLVAVDKNIIWCGPNAAYAVACWRAAEAHHILCLDNAHAHVLRRVMVSGPIPHVRPVHRPGALNLKLANGVYCGLRVGGAGVPLRQHRGWVAYYYCSNHQAVWAPLRSDYLGVHHAYRGWTVELANDDGRHHVHTVRVQDAYLVGTRH